MIGGRAVLFLCVQHYKKLPAVAAVAKAVVAGRAVFQNIKREIEKQRFQ
jgi:hypothetical protein